MKNYGRLIDEFCYGNSLFGEFGCLYLKGGTKDGTYTFVESRSDYHRNGDITGYISCVVEDIGAQEAFDEFVKYAEAYAADNHTVAGGF